MSTLEPAAQSKPPGGFKLWLSQLQMKHGRKLVIALPYIWLILLFLLPFLIVFKISLAEMARAIPPYTELMEWADGQLSITLNLGNFLQLTDDPLYFDAYLQSLQVAAISTFCCLLIGYPLAWAVAHSKPSTRNILLLLVILPLTKGGIIAGSMLVFIPAVGEFVIPELLGGPDSIMIGRVLWQEFFNNRDWPVASAVAIIMLLLLIVPIMWFHKHQQKSVGEHG
ncbi:putrescine ABC transporter permease [Escherichia coli]|uniref:ABC transporter permease subunit n=1 Tax=Escherichia coli TaxID=562 RepID=UPI0010CB42C8|nr:ABC transporter permease subunit [Escherichia coli]GDI28311.1 putrescine ABC transporter permease [Escherichia coli]